MSSVMIQWKMNNQLVKKLCTITHYQLY